MNDDSFSEYILLDIFGDIPGITSKQMFGGRGFYKDGVFFAVVYLEQLYFKVDAQNKADFENIESEQFFYTREGKEIKLSFWSLPEHILEDEDRLFDYVESAVEAGKRSKK